jgi:hypothetical protein
LNFHAFEFDAKQRPRSVRALDPSLVKAPNMVFDAWTLGSSATLQIVCCEFLGVAVVVGWHKRVFVVV